MAFVTAALLWAIQTEKTALAPIGGALAVWVVVGAAVDLWSRTGRGAFGGRLGRLARLPRADWGKAVAHAGFGITVFGVAALTAWTIEDIRVAQEGEAFEVAGFTVTLDKVEEIEGPNYLSTMATITLAKGDDIVTRLTPEKRFYPVAQMPTTEAAIDNGVFRDLYVVIGLSLIHI